MSKFKCSEEDQIKIDYYIKEIEKSMPETDFQLQFFESMKSQFEKWQSLSPKQIYCLDQIYERITNLPKRSQT
jgi:hypothetical protein